MIEGIGSALKKIREEKKLMQKDVAAAVGITATTLSFIESERRSMDVETAAKLAKYYGVSLDRLCGLQPEDGKEAAPKRDDIIRALAKVVHYTSAKVDCGEFQKSSLTFSEDWIREFLRNYGSVKEGVSVYEAREIALKSIMTEFCRDMAGQEIDDLPNF